ncbi:MAG: L-threonylcarbamoyladenylate synthase [Myxococcota bacterium]|nr:L-threonylcarbamoyladenylate synthase [Myxococcota bacterium]
MLLSINPSHPEPRKIGRAVEVLREGGVIAYPTGTVYGLGCALLDKKAIERVYRIKGAEQKKPFSFLCYDLSDIARYARVDDAAYRIMRRLVPGPYTFVLEATKEVPRLVLTKRNTVGIRVPDHPAARMLLQQLGQPIISTSASKDGRIETDPAEIAKQFPGLDLVLDAGPAGHAPSTVLAILENGQIEVLREGAGPIDAVFAPSGSRPPQPTAD